MLNTIKAPKQFEPIFEKAQEFVGKYFSELRQDPTKGILEISGERYILIRAASMSIDFFNTIYELYKDKGKEEAFNIARQFLFDIAHTIGKQDARMFAQKLNLKNPIEKLSAGPAHFSYSGWAFVDIFPESNPSPDENYYLIYDHPYSFESDAWLKAGKKSDSPACIMNAGYSSGWCEESFGISLVATEIMCKAKGDKVCRFIMAPPSKIEKHIQEYLKKEPALAPKIINYEIPGFFKGKQIEEERKKNEEQVRILNEQILTILDSSPAMIFYKDKENRFIRVNKAFAKAHKKSKQEIEGKTCWDIYPKEAADHYLQDDKEVMDSGKPKLNIIENMETPAGTRWVQTDKIPFLNHKGEIVGIIGFTLDITEHRQMENEIKEKMDELEKMNNLMTGRELKMAELKKEIEQLKKSQKL